jgi:osmotically-inducible protein OsmY
MMLFRARYSSSHKHKETKTNMNKKLMFALVPVMAIALWGCPSTPDAPVTAPVENAVSAVKDTAAAGAGAVKDGAMGAAGAAKDGAMGAASAVKDVAAGAADAVGGAALNAAVKAAIVADKDLNNPKNTINVDVTDKGVFLKGTVGNNDMKKKAGDVAQGKMTESKSALKLMNQLIVK